MRFRSPATRGVLDTPVSHASHQRDPMIFRKRHPPPGAAPGTLVPATDAPRPRLYLTEYSATDVAEREVAQASELPTGPPGDRVRWLSIQGLGDAELLTAIRDHFQIHPLAFADIVNTPQRPKLDPYDTHALLIARAAYFDTHRHFISEQVSIVLFERCVLTFEERQSDLLEPIRQRIRHHGPITRLGADFLAQAVIDTVVDGYYPLLEQLGEELEQLEHEVIARPSRRVLRRIHQIRNGLLAVRRGIYPQRDAIQAVLRRDSELFTPASAVYFRDAHDHAAQVVDVLESFRDIAGGLMEVYLTSISNRTGEVMKVLTVMSTIFIPLTFLVGIYGMNFVWMPELKVWWSYPLLWIVMLVMGAIMLVYFQRRGWLEREDPLGGSRPHDPKEH
jgi:magnesium transporter